MTVDVSLLDSCRTTIISQGISLHYNSQNKAAIHLVFNYLQIQINRFDNQTLSTSQIIYLFKKLA